MLQIISNGSKWAGQENNTIEQLLEVLKSYTLDPTFEKYGNFISEYGPIQWTDNNEHLKGCMSIFGNFRTLSHVFNIITDDRVIIDKLTEAIRNNQATEQYQEYRREMLGIDEINKTLPYGQRKHF